MPKFEVYIPAVSAELPVDLTLRVSSENWLAALKVGLEKICGARMAANVLCDVKDDGSVEVTDPGSGKVFRITELPVPPPEVEAVTPPAPPRPPPPRLGLQAPPPVAPRPGVAPPPAAPPPVAPRPGVAPPPAAAAPPPAAPRAPASPPPAQPASPRAPAPAPAAQPPRPAGGRPAAPLAADELPAITPLPSGPPAPRHQPVRPQVEQVARPVVAPTRRIGRTPQQQRHEEVLADVFVRVPRMHDFKSRDEGLSYLLELAMDKIACEAGFVLLSRGDQLRFTVGRGAKAAEVLKAGIPIPVGTGITGFCAQELVCLAVSDVEKDQRFFRRISRAVGYETRSMLCSPVVKAGRVYGAIELKNKKGGVFDGADLAVLAYLAHQAANLVELREAFEPL